MAEDQCQESGCELCPDGSAVGAGSEQDRHTPFVHKFATKKHRYLLDVNTSRVLRVPPAVWDIVEDVGTLARPDLISKYAAAHAPGAVSEACDAIAAAQQQGLLSSNRPAEIALPYDEQQIREKLATERTSLTLVVTEQCNFRCSYCIYGGAYSLRRCHSEHRMSCQTARRAIDEFLEHSGQTKARSVAFYGGEPLLNLDLIRQCIEYITLDRRQTDIQFLMTTNGSLLRGEAAEFVAKHRIRLNLSLDGPEKVHDRYRRQKDGSGSWRLVMDNLANLLSQYPQYRQPGLLSLHATVAPPADLRDLEEFFASCELFEPAMELGLAAVSPLDTTFLDSLPPDQREIGGYDAVHERFVRNMRDGTLCRDRRQPALWVQRALFEKNILSFYKRGYASEQHPLLPKRFAFSPTCIPGIRRLFVTADGSYYPCERVQETPELCIGSVLHGIDPTKAYELMRDFADLGKDQCCSCWCLPVCMAGCVAVVARNGKLDATARKEACDRCRTATHRVVVDVCEAMETNPQALRYMDDIVRT
jgi:uncharacterized protein